MSENRQELLQGFAIGLDHLIDQRQAETTESSPTWIGRYQSIITSTYYIEMEGDIIHVVNPREDMIETLLTNQYVKDIVATAQGVDDRTGYDQITRSSKASIREGNAFQRIAALAFLSTTCCLNMPDNWNCAPLSKHRQETTKDFIFRKAYSVIHSIATRNPSQQNLGTFRDVAEGIEEGEDPAELFRGRDPLQTIDAFNDVSVRLLAARLRDFLTSDFDKEEFKNEYYRLIEDTELPPPDEPVLPLDWEILSKDELGTRVADTPTFGKASRTENITPDDRFARLAKLVVDWGHPDGMVAVTNLRTTTSRGRIAYRAALLPQEIDGHTVYHAIADLDRPGHAAAYAFRAEAGMNEDGVQLDWTGVFNSTLQHARDSGARRIIHGRNFEENVLDYLTRKPENLDKPWGR